MDVSCTCKHCYKWTVCGHSTLLGMCFNAELTVPTKWEQVSPSLRKARSRRGLTGVGKGRCIAGIKRTKLERVMELDKQAGVHKAKRMCIDGPVTPPSPNPTSLSRTHLSSRVCLQGGELVADQDVAAPAVAADRSTAKAGKARPPPPPPRARAHSPARPGRRGH